MQARLESWAYQYYSPHIGWVDEKNLSIATRLILKRAIASYMALSRRDRLAEWIKCDRNQQKLKEPERLCSEWKAIAVG